MNTNKIIRVALKPYNERRISFLMEQLSKLVELYNTLNVNPHPKLIKPDNFGIKHLMGMVSNNGGPYRSSEFTDRDEEVEWTTEYYKSSDTNLPYIEIYYFIDLCEITIECDDELYVYTIEEINQLLDYRIEIVEE